MKQVLVIAGDTLVSFFRQRMLLALIIGSFAITIGFGYLVAWQEKSFENMHDVSAADLQTPNKDNMDARERKEQIEQGLEQMRSGQQAMFFGASGLGGNIISLLLFASLIAAPLRRGELRGILVRPLQRSQYLCGRFMGAVAALGIYWITMSLIFLVFRLHQQSSLPPTIGFAALLYLSKGMMLGSIAFALSLFTRPIIAVLVAAAASSDWVSSSSTLYYLLPGDDRLSVAMQLIQGQLLAPRDIALAVAYAFNVTLVALGIAMLRFRRIDIG